MPEVVHTISMESRKIMNFITESIDLKKNWNFIQI